MSSLQLARKFLAPPLTVSVGNYTVNYLTFTKPKNAHKTPMVILGGAFQKFISFKKDVEMLWDDFPVYLVDLPGQGCNEQLAPELDFEGLADVLAGFLERVGVERIVPVALSYGSAIGYHFASKYPERAERLILGGTTPGLRDSARHLLEESLAALQYGEMEMFSAGVVLNLMNFANRHLIPGADAIARALHKNLQNLSALDRKRYAHNTKRLLDLCGLPKSPQCEVLVLAGEYDNFTTPFECFQVAKTCRHYKYGIVKNVDHLAPYERKELVNKIYKRFMLGKSINRITDFEFYTKEEYPVGRMQMEPRWEFGEGAFLDNGDGVFIPVNIQDINAFGLKMYTSFGDHKSFDGNRLFTLRIPDRGIEIDVLIFQRDDTNQFRGIFKHCDFKRTRIFEDFIDQLAMQGGTEVLAS